MIATLHLKTGAVIPHTLPMTKTLTKPEIPAGFHYRDSDHSYFMDGKKMTGCTTILGVLNKPALVGWAARMACDFASAMIESGKTYTQEELTNIFAEAKTAHARKRDEGAQKGTDIHALVEEYVNLMIGTQRGIAHQVSYIAEHWEPIIAFVDWAVRENIRFISSEQKLYSKSLFVAGTADLIFEKDGKRYIGDIKTYKKIWDRVPFYQCAGYALMYQSMEHEKELTRIVESDINPEEYKVTPISGYCIINLPKERKFKEEEDIMWSFDTEGDTKAFLACVEIYRQNANFKPNYFKKS